MTSPWRLTGIAGWRCQFEKPGQNDGVNWGISIEWPFLMGMTLTIHWNWGGTRIDQHHSWVEASLVCRSLSDASHPPTDHQATTDVFYCRRKFRSQQYGQMEKQRWEESEKRREEERRSEKRKSQKKEDAGARKGRKVAIHCVFPMICGSRGSKSRLAKAAGAETSGQMNTSASEHF